MSSALVVPVDLDEDETTAHGMMLFYVRDDTLTVRVTKSLSR